MNILVLGSGLLGVTTAYELGKRGFAVTVIDRQKESAAECSFANGGQISYSSGEPWANPYVLPKVLGWMFDPAAPLVLRPRADWHMLRWGVKFLANCTHARAHANCVNLLRLNLYSRQKMAEICAESGIAFSHAKEGILYIFTSEKDLEHAKRHGDFQAKFGCEQRILSREECLMREPSLAHTPHNIIGGIHTFMDETGDAHAYCNALAKVAAERYGVEFHYGVSVEKIRTENNKITSVVTNQGEMSANGYVMAMGAYSPVFLRQIGITIPVYPMKGYSITLDANEFCPNFSVADSTHKVVFTRLGKKLRIAGTAEFAGYNNAIKENRIAPILRIAKNLFPKADWKQPLDKWACLRPSTPDGPPVIGKTRYANLFLNTGHGTLGWTQAAGSANIVADLIENKTPAIMLAGLTMENR